MEQETTIVEHPYFDNTAIIRRAGPWGFFHVRLKHGETPDVFKHQVFTGIEYAIREIDAEVARKLEQKPSRGKKNTETNLTEAVAI